MLQLQGPKTQPLYRLNPPGPLQIRSGATQSLKNHRKAHPLGIKPKPPALGQVLKDLGQSLVLPEATKDQRWTPQRRASCSNPLGSDGLDHSQSLAEFRNTLKQPVQGARGHQDIAFTQSGQYSLTGLASFPERFNDLQVFVSGSFLDATLDTNKHIFIIRISR
jgi:hypothetical protein